jgi:hypothetical protein
MSSQAASFDRAERQAFVARQFQQYLTSNPEIPQLIRKVWGLESAGHDFLAAMYPLFETLNQITDFLGKLPCISRVSADQAWEELHGVSERILDSEGFDEFRLIIELTFILNLNTSVTSKDIKRRVELTFAMILRMIQIEREATASG